MIARTYTVTSSMDVAPPSDGFLLSQFYKERDNHAFALLSKRYAALVYGACLRDLRDRQHAEDATQAVFLLLAQKAGTLHRHPSLAGWLWNTARLVSSNLRKQEARRQKREQTMQTQAKVESTETTSSPLWDTIEPYLDSVLARLKPDEREALLLRFWGDLSFAETGALLGTSENAARMRVTRVLEKMRSHLQKAGIGAFRNRTCRTASSRSRTSGSSGNRGSRRTNHSRNSQSSHRNPVISKRNSKNNVVDNSNKDNSGHIVRHSSYRRNNRGRHLA